MKRAYWRAVSSPVGSITLASDESGGLLWAGFGPVASETCHRWLAQRHFEPVQDDGAAQPAGSQIEEYFAGSRRSFDLPLSLTGSPLQMATWNLLLEIPFGETTTYGQLARRIGGDANARAVGGANASNPIAIIVPCHRVIGADGSLTGYAGGMEIKRWLLDFERRDTLF